MTKLGKGYYPVIRFKAIDREGSPSEATFDEVSCQTKGKAILYAKAEIKELQAEGLSDGIGFWAEALDTTKMSEKDRAIISLLLAKSK